jgi:thioredoxin reductase (NADPH)
MSEIFDVAIIGSGPAGLTAGIYTVRGAASTVIFAGEKWGGQLMLTTTVDNFPGFPDGIQGPDLILAMRKQAERFGAKFEAINVESVNLKSNPFEITAGGQKFLSKSVIVATGAAIKWLEVPGIGNLIGKGISSCAPCDAPFFKDKRVAVVGGGDSAMEEALVLTKYASEVTIIHRRDTFRASSVMQQKVLGNPKIKVLWNTEVVEVVGNQKLEKVILVNNKDNTKSELMVDGVFVAIGHKPESDVFKDHIQVDEKGFIKKNPDDFETATSIKGVFVAGDVHDAHYKQAVTAAGFGCMAALDALKYLSDN